ncbi:cupin domain-containing protein [Roseococcus sp. SYP-B2431]|uniref:cupin domain-containing protein n=1 Tax=Roseococcus sp. SYP-B2431 TaxID=2496640 RepID=UPI0013F47FB0|nr:cupin domain-containing protein [Roseococcus sp. SYP-B2431]
MRLAVPLFVASAAMAPAGEQAPAQPELLLRETIAGMPRGERQEVQVLAATIAPGQSTIFHTHSFPVTVVVLEGTFTLDLQGRGTVTVPAGRSMIEPPNVPMTGHNRSATEPARVIIFYVADPGTPFLHPLP